MGKYSECHNWIFYKRLRWRKKERKFIIYFQDNQGTIYSWMPKWKDVIRIFWRSLNTEISQNKAQDVAPFVRIIKRAFTLLLEAIWLDRYNRY